MTLQEHVQALIDSSLTSDLKVELIIGAVEADMIRRKSQHASAQGRHAAGVRWASRVNQGPESSPLAKKKLGSNAPPMRGHAEQCSAMPSNAVQCPALPGILASQHSVSDPDPDHDQNTECCEAKETPLLTFETRGSIKSWALVQGHVDTLANAFPGVDVLAEVRKAHAWVLAAKANRKTAEGMARFLFRWVSRTVDRGTAAKSPGRPSATPVRKIAGPKSNPLFDALEIGDGSA